MKTLRFLIVAFLLLGGWPVAARLPAGMAVVEAGTEGVVGMGEGGMAGAGGTAVLRSREAITAIPIITGDTMETAITAAVITRDTTADINRRRLIHREWAQDRWLRRCRRN